MEGKITWSAFKEDDDGDETWDLEQSRAHNLVNEIDTDNTHGDADNPITEGTPPPFPWIDPVYDAAGNMTVGPKPGSESTKHKYVYDAWNRLAKVTDAGGFPIQGHEYDGLGRRILLGLVYSGGSFTYYFDYYYNRNYQVLEERYNAADHPMQQYVWHPYYIDALAVRYYDSDTDGTVEDDPNAAIDGRYHYLHDANYNVTGLLEDDATVTERYHYTPYGEHTAYDGSWSNPTQNMTAAFNVYLYTGRRWDWVAGLYYYRGRYYNWPLARFMTRDPIGYRGGSMNVYQYVGSTPTVKVDPHGLETLPPDWAPPQSPHIPLPDWGIVRPAAPQQEPPPQMSAGSPIEIVEVGHATLVLVLDVRGHHYCCDGKRVKKIRHVQGFFTDVHDIMDDTWWGWVSSETVGGFFPPGDGMTIIEFEDGTIRNCPGAGPSSGAMLKQAGMIYFVFRIISGCCGPPDAQPTAPSPPVDPGEAPGTTITETLELEIPAEVFEPRGPVIPRPYPGWSRPPVFEPPPPWYPPPGGSG